MADSEMHAAGSSLAADRRSTAPVVMAPDPPLSANTIESGVLDIGITRNRASASMWLPAP